MAMSCVLTQRQPHKNVASATATAAIASPRLLVL